MLTLQALITCLMTISASKLCKACFAGGCGRQQFHEIVDKSPTNPIVLAPQRGPWHWKTCRRLCRQYFECLAFKVVWSGEELGWCTIYKGMIKQAGMIAEAGSSVYISCPADLVWDEVRDICHSPDLQSPQLFLDAEKTCRALYDYPGYAHPTIMTPRSSADINWLVTFAPGRNIRLGIYRPPNGSLNQFVYVAGNTLVQWTYWETGQPDKIPSGADYVASYDQGGQGHRWYDAPNNVMAFICEI